MSEPVPPGVGWQAIADASMEGIGLVDDERVVWANEEFAAAFGYDRTDKVVGGAWQSLYPPGGRDRIETEVLPQVRSEGGWQGEETGLGADGETYGQQLSVQRTDGDALVWVVRSVEEPVPSTPAPTEDGSAPTETDGDSSRRRIDHDSAGSPLRGERRFLQRMLDAVEDVVYVVDEGGDLFLWNETLAETTGYSHTELDAMHPMELIAEDHHEHVPGLMAAIESIDDRTVDVDLRTRSGERITHEFTGTTFTDPVTGETFRCGVARDVTERRERQRELEQYETIVETVEDGIYAFDEELRFRFVNEGLCELFGLDREEMLGMSGEYLYHHEDEFDQHIEVREQLLELGEQTGTIRATLPAPDGERIVESRYQLHPQPVDGEFRGSVGIVRDVTEVQQLQRELEQQRDELARLDSINELLLDTARAVVQTSSREAVERTICERLVSADRYQFAWVGERTFDGDRIVPRTSAGNRDSGAVTIADDSETGDGPVGRAIRSGEIQVATVEDPEFDRWHDAASDDGVESVAAIPLSHGETVYGVLVIHANREDAFRSRERSGLAALGSAVGVVIHAAKSRDLLFADAVVELEFQIAGESLLAGTAAELDCELALDGYVASGDQWVAYLDVDGVPPRAVAAALVEEPSVERARTIGEPEEGRVEIVIRESSVLENIVAAGGTVLDAVADGDGARLTVEMPADADIRTVVDHVRSAYPTATLVAHRERDREVTTVGRPGDLLDGLTDRQREVLETAWRAGYYAWPRGSSAEEVADALGLARPTLHEHLRKAETTLLAALLDDT